MLLSVRKGSEYALITKYTRVINILGFWICQGYTRFWIKCFMIGVFWNYDEMSWILNMPNSEDSEYVLNVLELHMVLNKIPHNRYLRGFWICLEFWICECYTGFCRKWSIIHVWQSFENPQIVSILRVEFTMAVKVTIGSV